MSIPAIRTTGVLLTVIASMGLLALAAEPVVLEAGNAVLAGGCSVATDHKDCVDLSGPPSTLTQGEMSKRIELLKKAGIDELVLIVRNFIASSHNYTYFNEGFSSGGGLYVFNKQGFHQLIDASKGQILDAELSYDNKEILFSWKKDGNTNYDIYLINRDGTNLRQLTQHPGNDFNASWLPDGGIVFLSDRDNNYAYCMHSSSAVLYRMEKDGSQLKRLSANYLSDIAPHVIHDGKIIFCRWEYVDRFQIPCQGLWAQNPDGTGLKRVYGGRFTGIGTDPVTLSEAKSVPGTGKLIATLTGHNGAICGGIGVIDPLLGANNTKAITTILGEMVMMRSQGNRNPRQKYEFPYPVNKTYFLVSNNGSIELSTYDGKDVTRILNKDDGPALGKLGFYAALPVQKRAREPLIHSVLPPDTLPNAPATMIMQDVYVGLAQDIANGTLKKGDIKQIRVLEELGKSNKGSQGQRAFCWQFPVVSAGATMEPKKTLGVVQVEDDGSAKFEVPSMRPIVLQALDAEGRVIQRMRTFAQCMPGEVVSCTGCHADRNTAVPENNRKHLAALGKPSQKLTGAPWKEHPSAFGYTDEVQPILDKHCITCHNAVQHPKGMDLSGDRTDLFNVSYDNLVRDGINQNPAEAGASPEDFPHLYISYIPSYNGCESRYMAESYFKPKSWGSFKSKLGDLVTAGHPDSNGVARVHLEDLEKRILYAFMDYNVPYYPTSFANHPELPHGMRELVPHKFNELLGDVAERRCVECHNKPTATRGWFSWCKAGKERQLPLKFYLRWEKPELNNFMLAPLAKAAGGTEACGKAVFQDKNDGDYLKLLHAFDDIHKAVQEIPRMDMPGAREIRSKNHSLLYTGQEKP